MNVVAEVAVILAVLVWLVYAAGSISISISSPWPVLLLGIAICSFWWLAKYGWVAEAVINERIVNSRNRKLKNRSYLCQEIKVLSAVLEEIRASDEKARNDKALEYIVNYFKNLTENCMVGETNLHQENGVISILLHGCYGVPVKLSNRVTFGREPLGNRIAAVINAVEKYHSK